MGSLIRICAVTAASLVALSFAMFAADQLSEGSENQVRSVKGDTARARSEAAVSLPDPGPAAERRREASHGGIREAIDDADDVLLSPFVGLIDSDNLWVQRLVPGVLGLLLYGLLGTLLANAMPKRQGRVRDWREARG